MATRDISSKKPSPQDGSRKFRGFLVVLHDTHKTLHTKAEVEEAVAKFAWRQYVVAEEPYEHQEGRHIHVFYQLKNPVKFKSQLTHWISTFQHKKGRVHVDVMRGDMSQACKYLVANETQDTSLYDPSPVIMLDQASARVANVITELIDRDEMMKLPHWYVIDEVSGFGQDSPNSPFSKALSVYLRQQRGGKPLVFKSVPAVPPGTYDWDPDVSHCDNDLYSM